MTALLTTGYVLLKAAYNSQFDNVKHVYEEQRKFDGVLMVNYYLKDKKGRGNLVEVSLSEAIIFKEKVGFIHILDAEKIRQLKPIRTTIERKDFQISFNDISIDSFRTLIKDKAIKDLKIQSTLPLHYSKDNEPQSSTSVNLSYIYNEVFKGTDIDSTDESTLKDISLLRLQLQENNYNLIQWRSRKSRALISYEQIQKALVSEDLAEKERAIKENQKAKTDVENMPEPNNNALALETRLSFLQSKLHIRKTQKISGFVSYITFK